MTSKRGADFDLRVAAREKGFTPRAADVSALLSLLMSDDDSEHVAALLAGLGAPALKESAALLPQARPPARARIAKLVGRFVADDSLRETAEEVLGQLVSDSDGPTQRAAIHGLGKSNNRSHEPKIRALFSSKTEVATLRAIARALGSIGTADSVAVLDTTHADPELARIAKESLIKIRRDAARTTVARIRDDVRLPDARPIVFYCKDGFELVLQEETASAFQSRATGPGRVEGRLAGTLAQAAAVRTAQYFALPLVETRASDDIARDVASVLASPATVELLRALTEGPIRYRLEWIGKGHMRAATFRVAELVQARVPDLINDAREAPWTAEVESIDDYVAVALRPRAVADTRFLYIDERVLAASHPTVAAALVQLGGVREDDVVWDPFAGGGTELIERARLGPYKRLIGSDNDADAIEIAKASVARANVERVELSVADARSSKLPEPPTLIVTNPPLGRRVVRDESLGPMLESFLAHAARVLVPGGRFVWLSPQPERTAELMESFGLSLVAHRRVDLGGVHAELQKFQKPTRV